MTPEDIKALRKELGCSARELAVALELTQDEIFAWERGERFPTKKHCDAMSALRLRGPAAIPKKKRKTDAQSPMQVLATPELWKLFRKLLAHAELRDAALALAERYDDPTDA